MRHMVMFYIWWLFVNGFQYFSEFYFLSCFVGKERGQGISFYVGSNCILTFLTIWLQLPAPLSLLLHTSLLFGLSRILLKASFTDTLTPAVIIFTLSTFAEGISVVFMRRLVTSIRLPALGISVQVLLSAVLALLFFLSLQKIGKHYRSMANQAISSYLYILLLPCAFVVWAVWYGLRLDNNILAQPLPFPAESSVLLPLAWIMGAVATFLVIVTVFHRIVTLTRQETEKALLVSQIREQKIYLAEARKRDEQLRSFQHDIHNHLLVISGLLKDQNYEELNQYFSKLHVSSQELLSQVRTGNTVLDILLSEKWNYARQNQIKVICEASLPLKGSIEDMDLCVLFANALDNAIQACIQSHADTPWISVAAKTRHSFLFIEITNSTCLAHLPPPGTGIKNMSQVAKKYGGTLETSVSQGVFHLSILLCLSLKPDMPSAEKKIPLT